MRPPPPSSPAPPLSHLSGSVSSLFDLLVSLCVSDLLVILFLRAWSGDLQLRSCPVLDWFRWFWCCLWLGFGLFLVAAVESESLGWVEMAALRSSLPSRLRQLLSGETAVGPSIRLDSETVSTLSLPPPHPSFSRSVYSLTSHGASVIFCFLFGCQVRDFWEGCK